MNILAVARILGPVLLKESVVGQRALSIVNQLLPDDHKFSGDESGHDVEQRLLELPESYRASVLDTQVEDERKLSELQSDLREADEKKMSSERRGTRLRLPHKCRSYIVIGLGIGFILFSIGLLTAYSIATASTGEPTATTQTTELLNALGDLLTEMAES